MNIENITMNPFTKIGQEWGLVSAGSADCCNTMTVSWGGVGVIWGKNVVFIFIRESRHTKKFIDEGETFSLAFLDESYRKALQYCGSASGRDENKWEKSGLTPVTSNGIVYPKEANQVFLCRKMAAVPMEESSFIDIELAGKFYADHDMHTMYVGEILDVLGE